MVIRLIKLIYLIKLNFEVLGRMEVEEDRDNKENVNPLEQPLQQQLPQQQSLQQQPPQQPLQQQLPKQQPPKQQPQQQQPVQQQQPREQQLPQQYRQQQQPLQQYRQQKSLQQQLQGINQHQPNVQPQSVQRCGLVIKYQTHNHEEPDFKST
ncbi:cAMP-dependent protein kinase catalytic subunit-like [Temnothorax curvispinosus]|uniref:cAMP-dependent protein kinase catalytic subunit-like n=1 Tax=Temnothorax curvispinosus TaxID=300111 RepID=A0A6J1RDD3_9HYME|nr:cAMP-dependent protein kinase catalytic subunit-like [Temnothorax curvispinosus]